MIKKKKRKKILYDNAIYKIKEEILIDLGKKHKKKKKLNK